MLKSMKMLLLPAVVLGIFASSATPSSAQDGLWATVQRAGELRCGTAEDPPYIIKDPATGEHSGLFVELCREFAETLDVTPKFVDTTWDNMVAGLQAGKWDLAMSLTATPQRALAIAFSVPVTQTEVTLLYRKGNPKLVEPKSISDVDRADVTIAVTSGSANDKYISSTVKNANIMRLPSTDEIRMAVMANRADIVLDTLPSNDMFAAAQPDWAVVMKPVPAINSKAVAFGLRRDTSAADLQVLNIFISDLLATGHIDDLTKAAIAQAIK